MYLSDHSAAGLQAYLAYGRNLIQPLDKGFDSHLVVGIIDSYTLMEWSASVGGECGGREHMWGVVTKNNLKR